MFKEPNMTLCEMFHCHWHFHFSYKKKRHLCRNYDISDIVCLIVFLPVKGSNHLCVTFSESLSYLFRNPCSEKQIGVKWNECQSYLDDWERKKNQTLKSDIQRRQWWRHHFCIICIKAKDQQCHLPSDTLPHFSLIGLKTGHLSSYRQSLWILAGAVAP